MSWNRPGWLSFNIHADCRGGVGFQRSLYLCVYLCFSRDISKTAAAKIVQLGTEMFHYESWKPFILWSKGQRSTSRGTKQRRRGSLHSCECRLLLVVSCRSLVITCVDVSFGNAFFRMEVKFTKLTVKDPPSPGGVETSLVNTQA